MPEPGATVVRTYPEQRADGQYEVTLWSDGSYTDKYVNNIGATTGAPTGGTSAPTGGGGISDAQIVAWANSLGRPDLVGWARTFVSTNGRLPSSLAELPSGSGGATGGGGGGGAGYWGGVGAALGDTNQQNFDWTKESFWANYNESKRQFDADLALKAQQMGLSQQQFEEGKRQFDRSQYSNLAQSLLSNSVELGSRPGDWLKYAQYTNGGKDIFQQLFGSQAAPAFGAPTGYSPTGNISDLLAKLGVTPGTVPGTTPPTGTTGPTGTYTRPDNGEVLTMDKMLADLKNAGWPPAAGGTRPSDADILATYERTANLKLVPTQTSVSTALAQATAPLTGGYYADASRGNPQPGMGYAQVITPYGGEQPFLLQPTPTAPGANPYQTPLPYQINPAVWDSLSGTAKQMILASANAGNTPSGSWTSEDFLKQLDAARPVGTAPRTTLTNWGPTPSLFG